MKLLILPILMMIFGTTINAMKNEILTNDELTIKKAIVKHVKELLPISEDEIEISQIDTLLTSLPDRYKYYQAVDKNMLDYNIICSYINIDKELFSSCEEKDFGRFLNHEKILEKAVTASQFVSLFDFFRPKSLELTIINLPEHVNDKVKDLLSFSNFDKHKDKLPQIKKSTDGIEVIFWASSDSSNIWQKSTVKVSKDYKITHDVEEIRN